MMTYYASIVSASLLAGATFFIQDLDSGVKKEYQVTGETVALSHQHAILRSHAAFSSWSGISDAVIPVPEGPFASTESASSVIAVRMDSAIDTNPEVTLYTWAEPSWDDSRNLRLGNQAAKLAEEGTMIGVLGDESGPFADMAPPGAGGPVIPEGSVLAVTIIRNGA